MVNTKSQIQTSYYMKKLNNWITLLYFISGNFLPLPFKSFLIALNSAKVYVHANLF